MRWLRYSWVGGPSWRTLLILSTGVVIANGTRGLGSATDGTVVGLLMLIIVAVTAALLFAPWSANVALGITAVGLSGVPVLQLANPGLFAPLGVPVEFAWPTLYAAFLAAAHTTGGWRRLWFLWLLGGTAVAMAVGWFSVVDGSLAEGGAPWPVGMAITVIGVWLGVGFFWMLGLSDRRRREERAAVTARADMAGVLERTRIAREMHDIVAHSLSGIIAQADGARYAAAQDPGVATQALATISSSARTSLSEMRGLLSVLRTDDTRDSTSAPGVPELQGLLDDARRNGLDLQVSGVENLDAELSELLQFTCYRIIQEMLTNMLKHADVPEGTLQVTVTPQRVTIAAANPATPPAGTGFGLIGMRERVKAHHGSLHHSLADGWFSITAELPR